MPVPFPAPAPDSGPAPPPVRPPYSDLPGYGNERKCRPDVWRGTLGRRKLAEMSPGRAVMHRWATDSGRNVPRACAAAPLGDENGRKCSLSVRRGTVGRRIVAEMFPERATRHRWATERGRSVPRVCGAVLLGNGMGQKCSPGVRRGTLGLRKRAEVFPECAARHRWATEWGRNVPRACRAAPLGDGNGRKCRPSVWSVPCV